MGVTAGGALASSGAAGAFLSKESANSISGSRGRRCIYEPVRIRLSLPSALFTPFQSLIHVSVAAAAALFPALHARVDIHGEEY